MDLKRGETTTSDTTDAKEASSFCASSRGVQGGWADELGSAKGPFTLRSLNSEHVMKERMVAATLHTSGQRSVGHLC